MALRELLTRPDDPDYTLLVIMWELGQVVRSKKRADHHNSELAKRGYLALSEMSMAGVITQCRLLCEEMGWNFYDLLRKGETEFRERMQDILRWKEEPEEAGKSEPEALDAIKRHLTYGLKRDRTGD